MHTDNIHVAKRVSETSSYRKHNTMITINDYGIFAIILDLDFYIPYKLI